MPTGAQLFVETLLQAGIRELFTLVGDHLNEVLSRADAAGIRIIDMRHESGVTHAADVVARQRRRPAVSLVTGGPGHTNSLTGIATAYLIGSPLVAVSGAAPAAGAGRQLFQVIDQVGMAAPVVKWAAQAGNPAQVPYLLGRAFAEATAGRMGPVHLSVPADVFEGATDRPLPAPQLLPPPELAPAPNEIEKALDLLQAAERPVVIAGSGVWWADAGAELREFLARTRLPHYSLALGRGAVPDSFRYSMGYADPALNRAVTRAFPEADLVLVLGKRIDSRLTLGGPRLFSPEARFLQIDIHAPELGHTRPLELGICAGLKAALRMMNEAARERRWPDRKRWLARLRRYRRDWLAQLERHASDSGAPIHPAAFFFELKRHLPPCLYAWDGGEFVHWGRAILPANRPGGWVRLGPLATIGAGLPNAIGLQIANPRRRVLMITGDGSLGFYLAELDTLVRHRLPVVVIVGNDGAWGVERELQSAVYGTTVGCELRRSRYDRVMQAFGGKAERITRLEQIGPAVQRAFASGEPYLLNVEIRPARSPFSEWVIQRKKAAGAANR